MITIEQDAYRCIQDASLSPGALFLRPPRSAPMWWNTCLGKSDLMRARLTNIHCHSDPIWSNLIQSDPICHLDLLSTDCAYPCLRCRKSWPREITAAVRWFPVGGRCVVAIGFPSSSNGYDLCGVASAHRFRSGGRKCPMWRCIVGIWNIGRPINSQTGKVKTGENHYFQFGKVKIC